MRTFHMISTKLQLSIQLTLLSRSLKHFSMLTRVGVSVTPSPETSFFVVINEYYTHRFTVRSC